MKTTTKTFRMKLTTEDALKNLSSKYGMTQTEIIEKSIRTIEWLDWITEKGINRTVVSEETEKIAISILKANGFYTK